MKTTKLVLSIGFILCSSLVFANIINVPANQPTIQAGINAAFNGDIVLVQPGNYVENINYNGKLITVASLFFTTQNTSYISSTTINGNFSGSVVTFNHFENPNAVLCGFTIKNGSNYYGGGIYCYGASPSLENIIITGNSANMYGGGIYCQSNSNPSLQNVTISGNSAINFGGGIFCQNSNPTLINSILWYDSPQEIYIATGSVTVTYSDIENGIGQIWFGTGCIDADPVFVHPGNGDFHLSSNSPCIDAGDPASPLDPDGTIVEMGAYYFPQLSLEADFTADITSGEVPLTVNFTDLSTQGSGVIDEWYWDFGDGNNSSLQNPANEYLLPGIYTVSLTVTDVNDFTDTETKVDYITVNAPAYIGPVWHISTTGSDITGNGSGQFPYATIQHGIDVSSNADTVLVQPGTYYENVNYNGKNITVASLYSTTQEPNYISSTIIDGNNSGSVVTFENGENSTAVLAVLLLQMAFYLGEGGLTAIIPLLLCGI